LEKACRHFDIMNQLEMAQLLMIEENDDPETLPLSFKCELTSNMAQLRVKDGSEFRIVIDTRAMET